MSTLQILFLFQILWNGSRHKVCVLKMSTWKSRRLEVRLVLIGTGLICLLRVTTDVGTQIGLEMQHCVPVTCALFSRIQWYDGSLSYGWVFGK